MGTHWWWSLVAIKTDSGWIPRGTRSRMSPKLRNASAGRHLQIEITVNDPKAYTKPWTVTVNQVLAADTDLLEYICLENEKDIQHMNAAAELKK